MPKFNYTVKDREAHLVVGTLEAKDSRSVVRELKKRNLTVISVAEEKTEEKTIIRRHKAKIKSMDLVIFCRQLATLIDSGVSLVVGLNILYDQVANDYLKKIVANLRSDIEAGNSLSNSFAKYPEAFPDIFTNMVKAGESGGSLNEILERLADYLERTENVRRKIKSSLTYPIVVVSMAIIIIAFLMVKVVPTFKNIFESLGGNLPLPTKILIKTSDLSTRLFPLIIAFLIISYFVFIRYINTEKGRLRFDSLKLRLPVFGPIISKVVIGRFAVTLASLVKSGVSILEAFDIAGKVSGNKVIEMATQQVKISMRGGENISEPMAETGKFSPFVVKMIAVGEQTGELEKMLTKISDYYEAQVNESLAGLTSMIEPIIISFLGVSVGFIVISMFLPIFKLSQMIGGR